MIKRDREELARYVRWVANELELRDWTIDIEHAPCLGENCKASCLPVDGQRHATISFLACLWTEASAEEQRETIVHELLHAHTYGCWRMIQGDLAEPLGKISYYVFCDSYRRAMELQVDALSKALAKRLPLIEWPKADRRVGGGPLKGAM